MMHEQRSETRLSPSSDTEDIVDMSSRSPRASRTSPGSPAPSTSRGPRRRWRSRSRPCRAPWSGSNRTWASTCSRAGAARSRSPRRAVRSSRSVERALAEIERAADEVRADADPATGKVAFGFLHTMGSETVPGLIRAFRADHPRVRFSLVQNYGEAMLERLRAGELDLCLTSPVPDAPDLVARRLDEQKLRAGRPRRPPPRRPQAHPPRRGRRRDLRDPRTRLRPAPHHRRPLPGGGLQAAGRLRGRGGGDAARPGRGGPRCGAPAATGRGAPGSCRADGHRRRGRCARSASPGWTATRTPRPWRPSRSSCCRGGAPAPRVRLSAAPRGQLWGRRRYAAPPRGRTSPPTRTHAHPGLPPKRPPEARGQRHPQPQRRRRRERVLHRPREGPPEQRAQHEVLGQREDFGRGAACSAWPSECTSKRQMSRLAFFARAASRNDSSGIGALVVRAVHDQHPPPDELLHRFGWRGHVLLGQPRGERQHGVDGACARPRAVPPGRPCRRPRGTPGRPRSAVRPRRRPRTRRAASCACAPFQPRTPVVHDVRDQAVRRVPRASGGAPASVRTAVASIGDGLRAEVSSPPGSSSTTPLTAVGSGPSALPSRASANRRRLLCHDRTVSEAHGVRHPSAGSPLRIDGSARQEIYARRG